MARGTQTISCSTPPEPTARAIPPAAHSEPGGTGAAGGAQITHGRHKPRPGPTKRASALGTWGDNNHQESMGESPEILGDCGVDWETCVCVSGHEATGERQDLDQLLDEWPVQGQLLGHL